MATPTFQLKQGDTAPAIASTLTAADGSVVNLTTATIRFHMADSVGTIVVDQPAILVGLGTLGTVSHLWAASEVATAGTFSGEWEVTFSDGTIETFPNNQNIVITITPALVNP